MYDFNFSWGIENKHWTKSGVFLFQKSGLKYSASQKNICNLIHSESKQLTWRRNLLEYGFSRNTSLNAKNEKAFSVYTKQIHFCTLGNMNRKDHFRPNFRDEIFFGGFSAARCYTSPKLQSSAISRKYNDAILRKWQKQ